MEKKQYLRTIKDVIYLAYCAVNERCPSAARVAKMDISAVYNVSKQHMLTAMCAMALESAGIKDERFTQAKGKAMRKNAQMEIDRSALCACLEEQNIWYMPLKGSIIKDYYPRYGMRQMSDNDILFDGTRAQDVKEIMESMGFTTELFEQGGVDVYHKPPVSNFEMHRCLFGKEYGARLKSLYEYYKDITDKLVKDEENNRGYHLSKEDFYIYMTAHEYKHYVREGTGLRSVIDTYVYLLKFGNELDMDYIEQECEKLGIADFERQSRSMTMELFSGRKLSPENRKMLKYIIFSGTYGNTENMVGNKLSEFGKGPLAKVRYAFSRVTVPFSESDQRYLGMSTYYPWFYEKKRRIPLLFFYRLGKMMTTKRKAVTSELGVLVKNK